MGQISRENTSQSRKLSMGRRVETLEAVGRSEIILWLHGNAYFSARPRENNGQTPLARPGKYPIASAPFGILALGFAEWNQRNFSHMQDSFARFSIVGGRAWSTRCDPQC